MSAPITVLYAEGNPADAEATRTYFARHAPEFGFELTDNAADFLARARHHEHSLLLVEQRLPDLEGVEVLRTLAQEGIHTPVVLVTGAGDTSLATQALRLRADDYIPKRPGYLQTLPPRLRAVVERRRQFVGPPPRRVTPRRILLIDDNPAEAPLLTAHLTRHAPHITVETAPDADHALRLLQAGQIFDLLLCDFLLPGMNGLDLIAEIRRRGLQTPFVLLTDLGNEEVIVAALKLGASDYLLKREGHYTELVLRIELAIDRHGLQLANDRAATELAERQRALSALSESERQLNHALEAGRIGLWSWELATLKTYFSPRWKAQLGYADHEIPNRLAEWFDRCHPDDAARMLDLRTRYLADSWSDYSVEYRLRHRDGTWRWFLLRAELDHDEQGNPVCMRGSQIDITEIKERQAELDHATARLQQLSRRLIEIQEAERRHLARELHDEIGQVLTATKMHLQSAALHPEPDRIAGQFQDAVALIDNLFVQIRSLSLDLRPPLLDDLGLERALHWLTERQQARASTPRIILHTDASMARCDPAIETSCFRIAQEALTNVIRHAQANTVTLTLEEENGALRLSVRDDGCGFDTEAARLRAERHGNLGLIGMQERLILVGGAFTLRSAPGRGTLVEAIFPLSPPPGTP